MKTNHLNKLQFKYMSENEQCPVHYFYNHLTEYATDPSVTQSARQPARQQHERTTGTNLSIQRSHL
jgi:hypothetical protein